MSVYYSLSWPLTLLIFTVGALSAALGWLLRAEVKQKSRAGEKTEGVK